MSTDAFCIVVDWTMHTLLAGLSCFIVQSRPGINSIICTVLLNIIYMGQLLAVEQQEQYAGMLELLSQVLQGLCSPVIAFAMAAMHSYFSLSRMQVSLVTMVLAHYRSSIAVTIFNSTGLSISWAIFELLRGGRAAIEVQLTFTIITSLRKTVEYYDQWSRAQIVALPPQDESRVDLDALPRARTIPGVILRRHGT